MPCIAPSRNNLGVLGPCGYEAYATNLCKFHWQMANGSIQPVPGVDQYTVLLMHMDGLDGSTVFTDLAGHQITTGGQAVVSTAQSKFGSSSGLFDGSDWLTTPDSPDWAFGAGEFTLECWVRFAAIPSHHTFMSQWPSAPNLSFLFRWEAADSSLRLYVSADGSATAQQFIIPWTPALNTWYHVAAVRQGSNVWLFVNGVALLSSISMTTTLFDSAAPLVIGAASLAGFSGLNGWLDEVRISKLARWTSNFSVPPSPYT